MSNNGKICADCWYCGLDLETYGAGKFTCGFHGLWGMSNTEEACEFFEDKEEAKQKYEKVSSNKRRS